MRRISVHFAIHRQQQISCSTRTTGERLLCMSQAPPAQLVDRRPFFSGQQKEFDEEAIKRSAAAAQQLGSTIGDPASIGAKLMSKMGFGIAGQGLGRAGQVSLYYLWTD